MAVHRNRETRGSGVTKREVERITISDHGRSFNRDERKALLDPFGFKPAQANRQTIYDQSCDGQPRQRFVGKRSFDFEDYAVEIECLAFDILAKAGCTISPIDRRKTNKPPQWIFGWQYIVKARRFHEDSQEDFAARILDTLRCARIAKRDGHMDDAMRYSLETGVLVLQIGWKPLADKGLQFSKQKAPRRDAIAKLIDAALTELGMTAKATAVWDHVMAHHGGVITDNDPEDRMIWAGQKRSTTFKAFQNRLAKRRKKFA